MSYELQYILCEKSYLLHVLIEENQLLGSVHSKEIINETELEESDTNDPKIKPWLFLVSSLRSRLPYYLVIRDEGILHLRLPHGPGVCQPADQVHVSGVQRPSSLLLHGSRLLCYLSPRLIGQQHCPFGRHLDRTRSLKCCAEELPRVLWKPLWMMLGVGTKPWKSADLPNHCIVSVFRPAVTDLLFKRNEHNINISSSFKLIC